MWLQLGAAVSAPLLYIFLAGLSWFSTRSQESADLAGTFLFALLALVAGMLGGLQFPAANRVWSTARARNSGASDAVTAGSQAGLLYGLDLAGACAGAAAISGFLVPVYGFAAAATVMALAAAGPAVLAGMTLRRPSPSPVH